MNYKTYLTITILSIGISNMLIQKSLYANSQVYNQTLNVDGQFTKRKLTQSEKMRIRRKQIERQTEKMVAKKIESIRIQKEIQMNKRIMKAMNQSMKQLDQI